MSQPSDQPPSKITSGAPSRPTISTTTNDAESSPSSIPLPPTPSPITPKKRRHSMSGPAQIMAQKVLDMNCEALDRSFCGTCEKANIVQALMNASTFYEHHAVWIEGKSGDSRVVEMKQAAEKWSFGNATEGDQMQETTQDRLISVLIVCLTDVRCVKLNRIDLIHAVIRDLD